MQKQQKTSRGFTLIELMIAVAVIGILAAIAIPNYQQYVKKSRRTEAQAVMLDIQQKQEKYRVNNASYASTVSALGGTTSNQYYTFSVSGASSTAYEISATAVTGGSQANDSQDGTACTPLKIDAASNKTPTPCWQK